MEFSGGIGDLQRRLAEGPAGLARRSAAKITLCPRPGGHYLDVGCGGGHLLRDLATEMQNRGSVVGIDISDQQLEAARQHCAAFPIVAARRGDVTDLDMADASLDGLACIQVLEYVEDLDRAFAEIARVVKPGGRIGLVSVLWDAFLFTGPEADLNAQMNLVWRAHCPHQMLPAQKPKRLSEVGFEEVVQSPISHFETAYEQDCAGYSVAKVMAAFAAAQGVADDVIQQWLDQLAAAYEEGRYGFLSSPVLTEAVRRT